jgi:ribose transport system substrate-binding protein
VGWKVTQCDGKFSPDAQVSCIRQAIADRADGIVLYVIDCANVKAALQDADKAGIPVVSGQGSDCNETKPGEPKLFDAATRFQGANSDVPVGYLDFLREEWARMVALAVVHGTNGKAKILDVYESDLFVTREQDKGVRKYLEQYCPGCEIVETVEHTGAEIGAPLQQKIEQALARHPDVNAIVNPYDAVTQITMAAVKASGREKQIYNVGCEGEPGVLDAIRQRKETVDAAAALSANWDYYAVIDAMNRLLHGEKEPPNGWPTGNGTQIVDAERNVQPPGAKFEPKIDFRTAYLKAWGVL